MMLGRAPPPPPRRDDTPPSRNSDANAPAPARLGRRRGNPQTSSRRGGIRSRKRSGQRWDLASCFSAFSRRAMRAAWSNLHSRLVSGSERIKLAMRAASGATDLPLRSSRSQTVSPADSVQRGWPEVGSSVSGSGRGMRKQKKTAWVSGEGEAFPEKVLSGKFGSFSMSSGWFLASFSYSKASFFEAVCCPSSLLRFFPTSTSEQTAKEWIGMALSCVHSVRVWERRFRRGTRSWRSIL